MVLGGVSDLGHGRVDVSYRSQTSWLSQPLVPPLARALVRGSPGVQCEFHMSLACPTLSEQILDAAQDGIICLDLAGRIRFANPAAARLLGFTGVDELHGQPVRTYIQFSGMGTVTNQPGDAAGLLLADDLAAARRAGVLERRGRQFSD